MSEKTVKIKHICPACGRKYFSRDAVTRPMYYELPCSEACAERMAAVETWLRRRGIG